MNTKQLPYILAIASTGSLSKAAEQLNISQPALSKYLAELEHQTGMELFLRHKKKLYPTPAGKVYLDAAREILNLQIRTRDSIRLLGAPASAEIHIGISPHRGAVLLAGMFPKFNQYFPQIRLIPFEGYSGSLKELLIRGKIDLALTTHEGELEPDLYSLPLHSEEIILAVPAFHRLVKHPPSDRDNLPYIDLKEFRESSFIMPDPSAPLYIAVQPLFAQAGFQPMTAFSSPNVVMAESMIRAGAGVGLLPAHYMNTGEDVAYFRLYHPAHLTACVLTRKEHELTKAERFLTFLLLQSNAPNPDYRIIWSQPLLDIIQEFDYTHYFSQYLDNERKIHTAVAAECEAYTI